MFLQHLSVHHMILNLLPPSHFLHDAHYLKQQKLDYILLSVPLIDPGHAAVTVLLFYYINLNFTFADLSPLLAVGTYNIASRVAYYSVEYLYFLYFFTPLAHKVQ